MVLGLNSGGMKLKDEELVKMEIEWEVSYKGGN